GFEMALDAHLLAAFRAQPCRIDDRPAYIVEPRPGSFRQLLVFAPGAVAPLAIDAFGQRTLIYRLGKRHVVSCRDLWISVVAEHAVIRNLPAEAFVIAPVVTRIPSPVAALYGVPA